jgi:hypothetical protein
MTIDELSAHIDSQDFKRRCAAVLARQNSGEDIPIDEIAGLLGVPLWFAQCSLLHVTEQFIGRIVTPETDAVQ